MLPFYSILKFSPNSRIDDCLGVGLIVFDGSQLHFLHSANKLSIVKKLTQSDPKLFDFTIKEVENKIARLNSDQQQLSKSLFNQPSIITQEYFAYLSLYSHGLLQFSAPHTIADTLNQLKIKKLFELLVDKLPEEKSDTKHSELDSFKLRIDENLLQRVNNRVHVHQVFNSSTTPILLNDFRLDCIGKNGALIGAKSVSFEKSKQAIHKSISTYVNIAAHLSMHYSEIKNDKFFLIADEPSKNNAEARNYYNDIRKNESFLRVVNSEDSAEIAVLIEQTDARTFLD